MAQQITIDIVAETKKLTQGLDEANNQIGGLNKSLTGITKAATAAASAFILKEGISFLKQGIDEAKDARVAMNNAVSAFGKGSAALKKITEDANKFGKALGVDNDDLIKLSTRLGTYLPESAKKLSAELVNLGYDVSALTGVDIESWTTKFAKGMADGELKASDLEKMIPGLSAAIYTQAEASFKAGDAQGALNLLIEEGQKTYGDAAEKNVTASQKFATALGDLKESVGEKLLDPLNKLVEVAVKLLEGFSALPGPVQNIIIGFTALVGIGGPLLIFFASAKTALITLGIASEGAAIGAGLLNVALKAIPVLAVIALIVLLVQNWDTISAKAKEVAGKVAEWFGKIYENIKTIFGNIIQWLKDNWQSVLLGLLTGPFGLLIVFLVKHKEEVLAKIKEIWDGIKNKIDIVKPFILDAFFGPFNDFYYFLIGFKDKILKVSNDIGKAIPQGIANGLLGMTSWFKTILTGWITANIPDAIKKLLNISSPSKVMMDIGQNITKGLYLGMGLPGSPGITMPTINVGGAAATAPVNITINAGLGTDPYVLGREVNNALTKYGKVSRRVTI